MFFSHELSISCILLKKKYGLQNSRTYFQPIFTNLKVKYWKRHLAATCLQSLKLAEEFQQHKLIITSSPAPKQNNFSGMPQVTACTGVRDEFNVCSLKRLKMEALNCWKKGLLFNLYKCGKNIDFILGPPQEDIGFHQVFSSILFAKIFQGISREP